MTATVAAPQGNQFGVLLAIFLVITFTTVVVYWNHERRMDRGEKVLYRHDEQLATLAYQMPALLEYLGIEINEPVEDDSPAAMAEQPDADTEEFPVAPATVPDGMPLVVQSALLAEQPHPVDSQDVKAKRAAWVEAELEKIRARIDAATKESA